MQKMIEVGNMAECERCGENDKDLSMLSADHKDVGADNGLQRLSCGIIFEKSHAVRCRLWQQFNMPRS